MTNQEENDIIASIVSLDPVTYPIIADSYLTTP
jgi:hypothetical protein